MGALAQKAMVVASVGLAAVFTGIVAANLWWIAIVLGILAVAIFLGMVVTRQHIPFWALVLCGVLITYPAFLPRPSETRESAATGGTVDERGLAQLVIVASVLAFCIWLWLVSGNGFSAFRTLPLMLLLPYGVLVLVSIAYAPDRAWSVFGAIKLLSIILLLVLLSHTIRSLGDIYRLLDTVVIASSLMLLVYWLDIARGAATTFEGRPEVSWLNPNSATLIAIVASVMVVARILGRSAFGSPLWLYVAGLLCAMTAMFAGSKSAIGAGAIGIFLIMSIVVVRSSTVSQIARIASISFLIVLGLSYLYWTNSGIVAHIQAYESNSNIDPTNLTGRVPVWNTAIEASTSEFETFLLGHGYLSTFAYGIEGRYWIATQAHNSFIQTLFDLGFVGLIVVIGFYIQFWRCLIRSISRIPTHLAHWSIALELTAGLAALSVVSLTEDIMGGVIESRTFIFLILVFCVFKNWELFQDSPGSQENSGHNSSETLNN
jgi:hypothetical protein